MRSLRAALLVCFPLQLLCHQFPYYTFKNVDYMYKVGSACYGIYFIVSFPMYYRYVGCGNGVLPAVPVFWAHCTFCSSSCRHPVVPGIACVARIEEEAPVSKAPTPAASTWDLSRVAIDSFGACMIVTMLLDFWRLAIGGVVANIPFCVPWM